LGGGHAPRGVPAKEAFEGKALLGSGRDCAWDSMEDWSRGRLMDRHTGLVCLGKPTTGDDDRTAALPPPSPPPQGVGTDASGGRRGAPLVAGGDDGVRGGGDEEAAGGVVPRGGWGRRAGSKLGARGGGGSLRGTVGREGRGIPGGGRAARGGAAAEVTVGRTIPRMRRRLRRGEVGAGPRNGKEWNPGRQPSRRASVVPLSRMKHRGKPRNGVCGRQNAMGDRPTPSLEVSPGSGADRIPRTVRRGPWGRGEREVRAWRRGRGRGRGRGEDHYRGGGGGAVGLVPHRPCGRRRGGGQGRRGHWRRRRWRWAQKARAGAGAGAGGSGRGAPTGAAAGGRGITSPPRTQRLVFPPPWIFRKGTDFFSHPRGSVIHK